MLGAVEPEVVSPVVVLAHSRRSDEAPALAEVGTSAAVEEHIAPLVRQRQAVL